MQCTSATIWRTKRDSFATLLVYMLRVLWAQAQPHAVLLCTAGPGPGPVFAYAPLIHTLVVLLVVVGSTVVSSSLPLLGRRPVVLKLSN